MNNWMDTEPPSGDNTPKIRVIIRKRPLTRKESSKGEADIIVIKDPQSVIVRETK